MDHYTETISKFLSVLNVDSIKDVKYCKKFVCNARCVCGQVIKNGYLFRNKKNDIICVVGKNCLSYVACYLGW